MICVQVVDVYFPKDRATNRRKNFCFVTFATQQVSSWPCMQLWPCLHWSCFFFLLCVFERCNFERGVHFMRNPT